MYVYIYETNKQNPKTNKCNTFLCLFADLYVDNFSGHLITRNWGLNKEVLKVCLVTVVVFLSPKMERSQGVWSAGRRNWDIRCHTMPEHWYSCETADTTSTSFAWKLHYLVVVCCWTHGTSKPFLLATKHQQDPADYYPSCVRKRLGCWETWKKLKPMYFIRLTHTSCAPHIVLCCEGRSHSALHPGKTRGLWLTCQSTGDS